MNCDKDSLFEAAKALAKVGSKVMTGANSFANSRHCPVERPTLITHITRDAAVAAADARPSAHDVVFQRSTQIAWNSSAMLSLSLSPLSLPVTDIVRPGRNWRGKGN